MGTYLAPSMIAPIWHLLAMCSMYHFLTLFAVVVSTEKKTRRIMEWLRRNLSRSSRNSKTPNLQSQSNSKGREEEEEERIYGITEGLINHVKSFTIDTFKNFPLQDEDEATYDEETQSTSSNVQNDLSQWQERHAILILSRVKEISQLRFVLCPRHLKEKQFWKIYFKLARSHVFEYELRAIQREKLKRMAMEDVKSSDNRSNEVEMAEAKPGNFRVSATLIE